MQRNSRKNRRALTAINMEFRAILLTLFVISNAIIASIAIPRPMGNSQNDDENSRRNFAPSYGAPLLTPLMEDVILEPNTNYSIRCEASEPIKWKTPPDLSYEVKTFNTLDPQMSFGSVLYLMDISHINVGAYYCIKKSKATEEVDDKTAVELVNDNDASTIYIYVNDPDNLLAPVDISLIVAYQYEDVIVPCKPTTPSVEVLLTTPHDTYSSEHAGRYNPKLGFVIEIRGVTDSGDYQCRPSKPSLTNEEEEYSYNIHFVGNEHTIRKVINSQQIELDKTPPLEFRTTSTVATTIKVIGRNARAATSNSIKSTVTNNNHIMNATNRTVVDLTTISVNNVNVGVGDINVNVDVDGVNINDDDGGDGKNISVYIANLEIDDSNEIVVVTTDPNNNNNGNSNSNDDIGTDADDNDELVQTTTAATIFKRPTGSNGIRNFNTRSLQRSSTRRPITKYLEKPNITSDSHGHVFEGERFVINCNDKIAHDITSIATWKAPSDVDEERVNRTNAQVIGKTSSHNLISSSLIVENARKSDSGLYECKITDSSHNEATNNYLMTVLGKGEGYINISEPNGYYKINGVANKPVTINVKYRGYPQPTLRWYKPDQSEIQPSNDYIIDSTESSITLKITNAQMVDSGVYVIEANNSILTKSLNFTVSITDAPKAIVQNVYVKASEQAHIVCRVLSNPTASVSWIFEPCDMKPRWPSCDKNKYQKLNSSRPIVSGNRDIEHLHYLDYTPQSPGIIKCVAENKRGASTAKAHIFIADINGNMTVYGIDENKKIARGDEVTITCAALAYYFSGDIAWYKDGIVVANNQDIEITDLRSDYSFKKSIKFKNIHDSDIGSYECRATHASDYEYDNKYLDVFVHEPRAPTLISTNLDPATKISRKLGDTLELECKSDAIPIANVNWYKDEQVINSNGNSTGFSEDNTKLTIPYIKPEDQGVYKCIVSNRLATVESSATVEITDLPGLALGWIVGIISLLVLLVLLIIYLYIRVNRERKLLRELKASGLANFEEGAVEHINPALSLDEQADLLPYDPNFEFPRDKLKLGKQLGAGAFGVVLKAHAEGIKTDEKESVVAVKMVKRTADNEVMRALVSELKIMVHLGQHLNVVNLLGAVTKNILQRELMVIVEYCRYGNVQNLLLRNRKRFINQINSETDKIDPTIITQRFSDNFELNRDGVKYVNLIFSNHQYVNHMNNKNNNYTTNNRRNSSDNDPRSGTRAGRPNSSGYLRQADLYEGHVDSGATENTVMTTIPEDDDNILSNNSVQPAWRSNYKTDTTEAMTVTTSDLVSWGFQVARGMDYLSSKKVLHGDLAARNILLCEDNIVKICDFGLARTMYRNDNYKKQGEAPLPIKWLALESLSDHVFSTYTDVWSFGIVLWEFFSLAKVPYPGMDPNQSLYLKLKDGYRMEKPPFANDELYDIMLECWSTNPESRPRFNELEKKFARLLGDEVTNHYVDLNEPYLRINTEYMERNQTDYLALMGSPNEMAPPPPRYVNGHILPEIRIDPSSSDDYLQMSTNSGTAIFSPTRPRDSDITTDDTNITSSPPNSFTFPGEIAQQYSPTPADNVYSPVSQTRMKDVIQPEEIPMLHSTNHGSDGEPSPEQTRKFTTPTPSPRHQVIETQLNSDDNYVNVKSPKKLMNNNGSSSSRTVPDAFSNPSYQMLKTVKNDGGGKK